MKMSFNDKLTLLGIRLSSVHSLDNKSNTISDIEDTIIECLELLSTDMRLISLLFSWVSVHGAYVVVEKLAKKIKQKNNLTLTEKASALACFAKNQGYHKWKKLIIKPKRIIYLYPDKITQSAVKLKGAIDYFEKNNILIPNDSLRIQDNFIMTREELAKINSQFKNRLLFGACWRADIITAIQSGLNTPTKIQKAIGCSYEPANRIFREYKAAMT